MEGSKDVRGYGKKWMGMHTEGKAEGKETMNCMRGGMSVMDTDQNLRSPQQASMYQLTCLTTQWSVKQNISRLSYNVVSRS